MLVYNPRNRAIRELLGQYGYPLTESPNLKRLRSLEVKRRHAKARQATANLLGQLRSLGLRHRRRDREHRFHHARRWRFDLCWPQYMVAVEIQGLGSHQHTGQFLSDCEKFTEAFALGWTVVPVTHKMIQTGQAATAIMHGILRRTTP